MMMKIRKGDRVRVMRGDAEDKGKVGEVIRVLPKENRIVVQGVNLVKKHQRQTQSGGKTIPSGIREFEAPIHISNVQLVTEASEKAASKEKKAAKPVKKSAAKPAAKATEAKPTSRRRGAAKPAADESGSEKLGAGENK
ncbi:MAG TPA: 50S ribosomal protein L24 [Anaerolineaceae bacterium]|nr:MAG: 50S ribosomal protein L24 [Anaerolineae bacterium 49_20]HAE85976.1 50S ribosomal protein L24 [Anaerolineaceae bacterium]